MSKKKFLVWQLLSLFLSSSFGCFSLSVVDNESNVFQIEMYL